jgi:nicotinate phosphoribosyltransferase
MTRSLLMTDLYQLTMAQAYFMHDMHAEAVSDLFVRRLPPSRRFLLAAGLQQAIEYLEAFAFSAQELTYLSGLGLFSQRFLDHLATLRFTGSVHAMSEGTPCFAGEPLLRVTAPIVEAQLVESRLLNLVRLQTLVASKAVRSMLVPAGRRLIDFGLRRAHGAEAALYGARAAYVAGFDASATVQAGACFDVPLSGTMAHSFVEAYEEEEHAFRDFLTASTAATTLLIDTYDSERAARGVLSLMKERRAAGPPQSVAAVRIDSGDLGAQAARVRAIFEEAGATAVQIVLSGGLNEYQIRELLAAGTPADVFGVGTNLTSSSRRAMPAGIRRPG